MRKTEYSMIIFMEVFFAAGDLAGGQRFDFILFRRMKGEYSLFSSKLGPRSSVPIHRKILYTKVRRDVFVFLLIKSYLFNTQPILITDPSSQTNQTNISNYTTASCMLVNVILFLLPNESTFEERLLRFVVFEEKNCQFVLSSRWSRRG